jgi:serine/threonine protein kinase
MKEATKAETNLQNLSKEIWALRRLRHPFCVTMLEVVEDETVDSLCVPFPNRTERSFELRLSHVTGVGRLCLGCPPSTLRHMRGGTEQASTSSLRMGSYMALEYCDSGTLEGFVVDGPESLQQARLYFRDVLLAVNYLHSWVRSIRDCAS